VQIAHLSFHCNSCTVKTGVPRVSDTAAPTGFSTRTAKHAQGLPSGEHTGLFNGSRFPTGFKKPESAYQTVHYFNIKQFYFLNFSNNLFTDL